MESVKQIVKWQHLVMIFLVATLQACTKRPEAEISSSKTSAVTNENIIFNNTSKDAESYHWDFGDGTTSEEASPTKAFDRAGVYSVKFTAFSEGKSKIDQAMLLITIAEDKKLNTYFLGSYQFDVTWNDACMTGHDTYNIEITPGDGNDQILIKNFMGKGMDGVKGKVVQSNNGYKLIVLGGQEVKDNQGNTWRIALDGDYVIDRIIGNPCTYANGSITKINPSGTCDTVYGDQGASCPSANQS